MYFIINTCKMILKGLETKKTPENWMSLKYIFTNINSLKMNCYLATTATVQRDTQTRRSCSSLISTCQTIVVRPI